MPIIVSEEVVDLVKVVRLLDEQDEFLLLFFFLRLDHFIQFWNTCVIIGMDFVFLEPLLDNQQESALFLVREEA